MILEYILKFHLDDCFNVLSEKDNLGYFSIKIEYSCPSDPVQNVGISKKVCLYEMQI